MSSQVTSGIIAVVSAVAAGFGVATFPPETSLAIATLAGLLAGWVGPSIVEWGGAHRNAISAATTTALGVVAYLVAHNVTNQKVAGMAVGIVVAVASLFVPSTAHPSRLP